MISAIIKYRESVNQGGIPLKIDEIIRNIAEAERQSREEIEKAKKEVEDRISSAKEEGKKLLEKKESEAQEKRDQIMNESNEKAEQEVKKITEKNNSHINELKKAYSRIEKNAIDKVMKDLFGDISLNDEA